MPSSVPIARALAVAATCLAATLFALPPAVAAEPMPAEGRNVMVVFDGSGSMWGRVDGRAKIEIARETLSSVLSEASGPMSLGMIAYGHRSKGRCDDIETMVEPGPAERTLRAIVASAKGIVPKGKTPLTDAVRQAAEALKYTENEATVVLVTDGIETCRADPCALAAELERNGIDFTAHVVGFGLSEEEGRQVACLADRTGGRYFSAGNAGQLGDALRQTIAPKADMAALTPPPAPAAAADAPRNVRFVIRDSDGRFVLNARELKVAAEPEDPSDVVTKLQLGFSREESGTATMTPGVYRLAITRKSGGGAWASAETVTVTPGPDVETIELAPAATLVVRSFVSAGEPLEPGQTVASAVAGSAGADYDVFRIDDGRLSEKPVATGYKGFEEALPPGTYMIRGNFARTITREKLVRLERGETRVMDFDFGLARLHVAASDAAGVSVTRQTSYLYDAAEGKHFVSGGGGLDRNGERKPFFLTPGLWRINAGQEGGGKKRSERIVRIEAPGRDVSVEVGEGEKPDPAALAAMADRARPNCLAFRGVHHKEGCVVEAVDPAAATVATAGPAPLAPGLEPGPEAGPGALAADAASRPVAIDPPDGETATE
ncbi:vWA domain-containing protein [Jiella avicenniae]|uniref:VWA domain-containing protein n=1 Tax=Jiella avicenniae TaxID=2907202 RepID=A0A9X1NZQ6_9HYPH|nr:VWA domain-containing protein [Jiella avicenniae]MCE7028815.1 VWA domain-containing protein [Jiella avicenniae]